MDIHIANPSEFVRVFADGALKFEIAAEEVSTLQDLESEVHKARCLQVLKKILDNTAAKINGDKYSDGFVSGLRGESEEHSMPGVPNIPPNSDPDFHRGWSDGQSILNIINQI